MEIYVARVVREHGDGLRSRTNSAATIGTIVSSLRDSYLASPPCSPCSARRHDADGLVEALPMRLGALRHGELVQARPA